MNAALVSVVLAVATSSCGGSVDFAPQTPDPSPPAVVPMTVELIIDGSRPKCAYRVLGSVFTLDAENGLEALRERAALEGATGVYDIDCKSSERTTMFGTAVHTGCSGRVYVCGDAKPGGGA